MCLCVCGCACKIERENASEHMCLICPAKWNTILLHINPNRKPGNQWRVKYTDGHNSTQTTVMKEEQIHRYDRNAQFSLQANNWEQKGLNAALNDFQLS